MLSGLILIFKSDIPVGLGVRLAHTVQPDPGIESGLSIESGPDIQPNTERGKNNSLLPAVILGIIVIGAGITYHFWPAVKGAAVSCKTVVSNKQLKLTGILYSDDPSAIVNGEIVKEGDMINGAKVIKIYRDKVEFEEDGEKWTKRVY